MHVNKYKVWCKNKNEWEKDPVVLTPAGDLLHVQLQHGGWSRLKKETHIPVFYTGLKDKNGKEIYEGDLIKEPFGAIRPVVWKDSCYFIGDNTLHDYHCGGVPLKIEVIGNIYENPELLEKGEY